MRRERVWLDPLEGLLQRRGNGLPRMRATRRLECRERAYQVRRGCANPLLGRLTSSGGGCLIPLLLASRFRVRAAWDAQGPRPAACLVVAQLVQPPRSNGVACRRLPSVA